MHEETIPDIAVMFQVHYDTPAGTAVLTVLEQTPDAAARGVKYQISHRPAGEGERRSPPLSFEEAAQTPTRAPVLDGDNLYLRIIDRDGRDLAVSKIDEARWPRDATPTTVKTVSYWLFVPHEHLIKK